MKKKFDAVRLQRKIRNKLGKEYLKDRKSFLSKLKVALTVNSKLASQN